MKILYVTPERLNNEGFVGSMIQLRQRTGSGVGLIAVDEAHCVSEWGHAFRPDYLKVARFSKEVHAERVVCLTATATPKVASDICRSFDIDESTGLFKTESYRPNLTLLVEGILPSPRYETDKLERLCPFLKKHPGSTIVYVTLQKQTESLAAQLNRAGFDAVAYHAGMKPEDRTAIQNQFMKKPKLIIVATIAFGMGIDKEDIRNVVHFDFPRSLEGYSQEIGRAGRDGKPSTCLLYLCGSDMKQRIGFSKGDTPRYEDIRSLLSEIFVDNGALKPGDVLEVKTYDQSKDYDIRPATLANLYAQLELHFQLMKAITPKYRYVAYALAGFGFRLCSMFHAITIYHGCSSNHLVLLV